MSSRKVQHLIDVDDNILAELFVSSDSDLDKSMIERIRLALDIKYCIKSLEENTESLFGDHRWDVLEYDKLKFIKIYPNSNLEHKMVVVIAACTKNPTDVVGSVIGYMNETEKEEQPPLNLFG